MRMTPAILVLVSCKGCFQSCGQPDIPRPNEPDPGGDSGDSAATDTADTDWVDTAPPPPCDHPEVEPNSLTGNGDPTELEFDTWACGTISQSGDLDGLRFTLDEEGDWVRFEVVAAQTGSSADINVLLLTPEEYAAEEASSDFNSIFTTDANDPAMVFPVGPGPITFEVELTEVNSLGGEDYHWKFRPRVVKAPVDWSSYESEPNDVGLGGTPNPIAYGERVFGGFASTTDNDGFTVEVPEPGKGETQVMTVDVDAFRYGAPTRAKLSIVKPDGEVQVQNYKKDEWGRTADPYYTFYPDQSGTWDIRLGVANGAGGATSWYVLEVNLSTTKGG